MYACMEARGHLLRCSTTVCLSPLRKSVSLNLTLPFSVRLVASKAQQASCRSSHPWLWNCDAKPYPTFYGDVGDLNSSPYMLGYLSILVPISQRGADANISTWMIFKV